MKKSIGEIKQQYERVQRIIFIIMFILGVSIVLLGLIFYFFFGFESILAWTSILGTGIGLFGGLGTFLTNQVRLDQIGKKKHDYNIVHPEYRDRDNKPVKNYIKTPTQGIFVVVLYLTAALLMLLGALNLFYWLGNHF